MDIVVKIPDDMIKLLEQGNFGAKYSLYDLVGCLMCGTPLPEHHGDLIDRNDLLDEAYQIDSKYCMYEEVVYIDDVENAPTIIEADECTYKETGCGSCKWQLNCPIEAEYCLECPVNPFKEKE